MSTTLPKELRGLRIDSVLSTVRSMAAEVFEVFNEEPALPIEQLLSYTLEVCRRCKGDLDASMPADAGLFPDVSSEFLTAALGSAAAAVALLAAADVTFANPKLKH